MSTLVFDQTSEYCVLAKLTHKLNHHLFFPWEPSLEGMVFENTSIWWWGISLNLEFNGITVLFPPIETVTSRSARHKATEAENRHCASASLGANSEWCHSHFPSLDGGCHESCTWEK